MGQRLNIAIKVNGAVIANSYFHWSAYTSSSIEMMEKVISDLGDCIDIYEFEKLSQKDQLKYAIYALHSVGAGFNTCELERIASSSIMVEDLDLPKAIDRNEGFIDITDIGMAENDYWREGYIEIDLSAHTVYFDIFGVYELDEFKECVSSYHDNTYPKINKDDIPNFNSIPIDEVYKIKEFNKRYPEGVIYEYNNTEYIILWTE